MNSRILVFALIFAINAVSLSAQDVAPLIGSPSPNPTAPPIAKKPRTVFLDIPILPMRKTIHLERVRDGRLNLGPVIDPWEHNVIYRINLTPTLAIEGADDRMNIAGGFAKSYGQGGKRNDLFFDYAIDRPIWRITAGAASFAESEGVNEIFEIADITGNFSRVSIGAKGWGGVKIGSFNDNFFFFNGGGGYIKTKASVKFRHPTLRDIEPAVMYDENYWTYAVSAEGQKVYPRISGHFKVEGGGFTGSDKTFYDLTIRGVVEVLPLKRFNSVRLLVSTHNHVKKQDELLFRTTEPELQVYLRVKIR